MLSASFVYLALFTIANIFLNLYFHKAADIYRKTRKLPNWASSIRTFLETTDLIIKPTDIKDILDSLIDNVDEIKQQEYEEKIFGQAKPLRFLHLETTSDNLYDLRDDFEFRQSVRKNSQNANVIKLNEHRISVMRHNNHDNDLREFVGKVMEDIKNDNDNMGCKENGEAELMTSEKFTDTYSKYLPQENESEISNIRENYRYHLSGGI